MNSASFRGEKIGGTHFSFCKSMIGKASFEYTTGLDGVGLGGGNWTSKLGAGRKGCGLGEEYDDQEVGKVRRIKEDDWNGGVGVDSSEDVRGTEGIVGGRRRDGGLQDRRS